MTIAVLEDPSITPGAARAVLVTHGCGDGGRHEDATHRSLTRRLAAVLGMEYGGAYKAGRGGGRALYHVPRATLVGTERARELAVRGEADLFGGWVPFDHMATKAIMHPLVSADAAAPEGWRQDFAERAAVVALRGFTACSAADALAAGQALLKRGPVRLKPVHADGARGQTVVTTAGELEAVVAALAEGGGLSDALVLEENLDRVETFSVGQVRFDLLTASYCGTQSLTTDNAGNSVYGGSELFVVRGGFDALLGHAVGDDMRQAIEAGARLDALADEFLPGLIASRRNYDVACGVGPDGARRCGVLEQSWRVGGATGAEIAALEVLVAELRVAAVRARTVERYGDQPPPPVSATVHFRGTDPAVGQLTKYAIVEERIDAG